jgi:hypothetical protein
VGALNAIPAWKFKDAHHMWGQSAIPTLWLQSTLYGKGKSNICMTIYECTFYARAKCNTHIMSLI